MKAGGQPGQSVDAARADAGSCVADWTPIARDLGTVAGILDDLPYPDCRVITEGIEPEAEAATLRRLGVGLGQGYLFGRPVAAADLA